MKKEETKMFLELLRIARGPENPETVAAFGSLRREFVEKYCKESKTENVFDLIFGSADLPEKSSKMNEKRIPGPTMEEIRASYTGDATCVISEPEKRYLAMIRGETPLNESEVKMQQEIIQMKKEGKIIDIPSM